MSTHASPDFLNRSTAMYDPLESTARHQIRERVSRASAPKVPAVPTRHRMASHLRRIADKIDN